MCGIGGYFLKTGASAPDGFLDRMEAALAHRGPDGSGRFTNDGAGFVHTRLSIVDLRRVPSLSLRHRITGARFLSPMARSTITTRCVTSCARDTAHLRIRLRDGPRALGPAGHPF